jgi:hypothetical protein
VPKMRALNMFNRDEFNRDAWFTHMGSRALQMINQGANGILLGRFEMWANRWLEYHGLADPNMPFRVIQALPQSAFR